MTVYYEEIMELWQARKFFKAISYFSQLISETLLNEEEIENLNKNLSKFWELLEEDSDGWGTVELRMR